MTKDEWITRRTQIISDMLDNPNVHGIYPTSKCFKRLDVVFDDALKQIKIEILDHYMAIGMCIGMGMGFLTFMTLKWLTL